MAVLVTAIPLSSTDFLSTGETQPGAECLAYVRRAAIIDFVARQKHGFTVHNAISDRSESFRRDFFRT
jgi:hypothetical protein